MSRAWQNGRVVTTEVDCQFVDRWSPRALDPQPLSEQQVQTLFEAARWAPSCFNEQPWLFRYAVSGLERDRFANVLLEKNRRWAATAPLLLFVLARRRFAASGKENRHAAFDAGAAWMALALQARRLGLFAHAMAGFRIDQAYELLQVSPQDYDILAAVAVGRYGDPARLPADLQELELPNGRKLLSEVAQPG